MLRNKNLIPLSHQHQRALALCVRIDRATQAGEVDLEPWQSEIQQIVEHEIAIHFEAEERELFPVAAKFEELKPLIGGLLSDHAALRDYFTRATRRQLDQVELRKLAECLSAHIRKEERQLFEGMQQRMTAEELAVVGTALEKALQNSSQACMLRPPATKS